MHIWNIKVEKGTVTATYPQMAQKKNKIVCVSSKHKKLLYLHLFYMFKIISKQNF